MYEIWKDGVLATKKMSLVSACMTAKASALEDRQTYEVFRVPHGASGDASATPGSPSGEKVAVYRTQRDTFRIWMA